MSVSNVHPSRGKDLYASRVPLHNGEVCSQRTRVLHLIKGLNRGGAEVLLLEGAAASQQSSYEYSYAFLNPRHDALRHQLEALGARVWCAGAPVPPMMLLTAGRVARFVREHHIELLHAHLPVAGVVGRLAGRLADIPVVYTEHNKVEYYRRATYLLNKYTYSWQNHVVAVSESVHQSIKTHIRPRVPVTVVHNGIDVNRYERGGEGKASVRTELRVPDDAHVVGLIASFTSQKRLDVWLDVARKIAKDCPSTFFLLVGQGPLQPWFEREARSAGLHGQMRLVGDVPDVRPLISAMDVYLMTSAYEGLPVSLLEAMAMACPPVCTAVGGIPEVIDDGLTGYLTRAGDSESLSRRVRELLGSERKRVEIGEKARQTVHQRFRISQMIGRLEEIYGQVLGVSRKGPESHRNFWDRAMQLTKAAP
jgi:L-malate glycosyltransferase